jgi:prepilin-type N-terminal cleavage/methylation domain-containing protein
MSSNMSKLRVMRSNAKGFTIMELLIATMVFGVVLLVVSTAILQFTRVYYKGITESKVQEAARTIADAITQGIQFSGGTVTSTPDDPLAGGSYAFCIGDRQYSYQVGHQLTDGTPTSTQKPHALVHDYIAGCTSSTSAQSMSSATVTGREMLEPRMRLAKMEVTSLGGSLYKVSVKVVYGDDDLLDDPTTPEAKCKNIRSGTQFCAVSDITTTVVKRVE